ncbi:hypothetical protein N2601_12715 [Rhizobium sp. CB3060]|uniref:hypothetical protein n=1 Tax=Rhizobium sp. CB3060 TaxID=3138255 RepID=UPI0021A50435|nr:hypothetical protein [Rhizobium tropici]UWU20156.1 hypothetical protein N2601_12715 [Rhizobium tropici]
MSAKACPHCGARRKRSGALKWVGGVFLAFVVIGAVAGANKPSDKTTSTSGTPMASASKQSPLPASQRDFLAVVADYKERFRSASNELQQSALRDERRAAILKALASRLTVENWAGTLRNLETNTEGKAIITVRLASDVDVMTWNNSFSDVIHRTMIDKGTPLYAALMNMSVGDPVIVSGSFIPSDQDGMLETSVTIDGSMTAPEFLFQFSKISKQ